VKARPSQTAIAHLPLAFFIAVDDDANGLADERFGVVSQPVAFPIRRAGGDNTQISRTPVGRLLTVYDKHLGCVGKCVQAVKYRLFASPVSGLPTQLRCEAELPPPVSACGELSFT